MVRKGAPGSPVLVPDGGDVDPSAAATDADESTQPSDSSTRMPIEDMSLARELQLKERSMDEAPVGITIADASSPDTPLIYVNDAFERLTGYPKEETIGRNCRFLQGEDSDPDTVATMREAIRDDEPVSVELVNYRKDGEPFWNRVDIAPLRDDDGTVTHYVGFQTDVTERREAEARLREERRNLDRLLSRVNGLIEDVTRGLVQSVAREDVEALVCERFVETETYAFAWIGRPDLATDRLEASARAGDWDVDADDLVVDLDGAGSPVARAVETREIQVVDDVEVLRSLHPSSTALGDLTSGAMVAVPLAYRDTLYGVLSVYTADPDALDERETAVLASLGRAVATAINALESRRILSADSVVELELEVRDPRLFFVDLSARADCTFEYEGSVYRSDGTPLMFFTADADPDRVLELAGDHPSVERAGLLDEREGAGLFEFELADASIVGLLAERGAKTLDISATGGTGRIRIELPTETDARSIVELLEDRYEGTALSSYHERERPPTTEQEFIAALEDRLTDRQLTALQKAYVSGFYEWNRPVSGSELAESMGISRSTFHQHLRAAERKLVEEFFSR